MDEHITIPRARLAALEKAEAERDSLLQAAASAAHYLTFARIWKGADWHYNPLHPMHYKPALDCLRETLDQVIAARGGEKQG